MVAEKPEQVKKELAKKAEDVKSETKLKKSMSIAELIKVMEPEIKRALPEVITPERFTRMALYVLQFLHLPWT